MVFLWWCCGCVFVVVKMDILDIAERPFRHFVGRTLKTGVFVVVVVVVVLWLWFCGGVFEVVFWCFCGGVVVVLLWWCF